MTAPDPATRELLAALVDLDERTRDLDADERSWVLAYASGVLRGVLHRGAGLAAAAATLSAWGHGHTEPDPPLLTRPHDWPIKRRER
jgi:hypothetical protein